MKSRLLDDAIAVDRDRGLVAVHAANLNLNELEQLGALISATARQERARRRHWPPLPGRLRGVTA